MVAAPPICSIASTALLITCADTVRLWGAAAMPTAHAEELEFDGGMYGTSDAAQDTPPMLQEPEHVNIDDPGPGLGPEPEAEGIVAGAH